MALLSKATLIAPRLVGYSLARHGLMKAPMPINITFSVTHACQSLCKTCNIGEVHRANPERVKDELTLDEIEKMFKSIGKTYFFNISGGEPFLRQDLPEIIKLAIRHLKPGIIHTPTNALMPQVIEREAEKILKIIEEECPGLPFTIKPSFDAVGSKHDDIRGVKGNWEKLIDTLERLKKLRVKYPNLHIGVGTVISNYSIDSLEETAHFAETLGVDSYINEIAEKREEMFNIKDPITPSWQEYDKAITLFKEQTKKQMKKKRLLSRIQMSLRLVYYDLAVRILKEERQVIPCYGGISNVHISAYGDIWPCCILAYKKSMGNIRDTEYDFKKVWNSDKSNEIRDYIRKGKCHCPLANQAYSNILLHPQSLLKSAAYMFFFH